MSNSFLDDLSGVYIRRDELTDYIEIVNGSESVLYLKGLSNKFYIQFQQLFSKWRSKTAFVEHFFWKLIMLTFYDYTFLSARKLPITVVKKSMTYLKIKFDFERLRFRCWP